MLGLLLVAMMGPWTYDRINVPSRYSCAYPYVRLDGDFCGIPYRGITVFSSMARDIVNICVGFVTHTTDLTYRAGPLLFSVFLLLLVLSFLSTFFLILRGDHRGRQVFSIVTWGMAAGICLLAVILMGLFDNLEFFRYLWGIWLYIGVAVSALTLEVLALVSGRNSR